jgi:hypothetical protein
MMPALGSFRYDLEQNLLDDKFQYVQMGIPANIHRRIPFIYTLPKTDASLSQGFVSAAQSVINNPMKPALAPLDRDQEIFAWYGQYVDFHPRLGRFCSLDLASAWDNQTRQLIGRIKGRQHPRVRGLPERMATFWINMYQAQINDGQTGLQPLVDVLQAFRAQVQSLPDTPDDPLPPLTAIGPDAGNLAAIPAWLFDLMSATDTSCCGQSHPIEELLP